MSQVFFVGACLQSSMHKQTIRLQAILDQADAKERDRCADRAPNDSADSVVDRYFTELLQLAANDVDLVEAGYVVPDFLNRIIEMGCQRWAQLEIDRIKSTDKVVE